MADQPIPDPVVPDPGASYGAALDAPDLSDDELAVVEEQLGRPSRARSAIVHRCAHGLPTVLRVDPRLEDGTPFPTTFWLTCPALNSAIGRLEGERRMDEVNERLDEDPGFHLAYTSAQYRLVEFRDELGGDTLPGNPTAGGRPGHVKCLHTAVAHHLGTGDNVVGAWALDEARPVACPGPCAGPDRVERPSPRKRHGQGGEPDGGEGPSGAA